jgi:hypothetical protein
VRESEPQTSAAAADVRASAPEFTLPPWFWAVAFVVGVVFLTGIRPFLRRVPAPPPVLGTIATAIDVPGVALDGRGEAWEPNDAEDTLWLVAMIDPSVEGWETGLAVRWRVMRKLAIIHRAHRPGRVRLLTLVPIGETLGEVRARKAVVRAWFEGDYGLEEARLVGLLEEPWSAWVSEVRGVWSGALEGESAPSVGWRDALVMVHGDGRVRGYFDPTTPWVVSEVYHRLDHAWADVTAR